jgi:hypothetical protein
LLAFIQRFQRKLIVNQRTPRVADAPTVGLADWDLELCMECGAE